MKKTQQSAIPTLPKFPHLAPAALPRRFFCFGGACAALAALTSCEDRATPAQQAEPALAVTPKTTPITSTIDKLKQWSETVGSQNLPGIEKDKSFCSLVASLLNDLRSSGAITIPNSSTDKGNIEIFKDYLIQNSYYLGFGRVSTAATNFDVSLSLYKVSRYQASPDYDFSYMKIPEVEKQISNKKAEVYVCDSVVIASASDNLQGVARLGTCFATDNRGVILLFPQAINTIAKHIQISIDKLYKMALLNEAGNLFAEALLGREAQGEFAKVYFPDGSQGPLTIGELKEVISDWATVKYAEDAGIVFLIFLPKLAAGADDLNSVVSYRAVNKLFQICGDIATSTYKEQIVALIAKQYPSGERDLGSFTKMEQVQIIRHLIQGGEADLMEMIPAVFEAFITPPANIVIRESQR